MFNEKIAHTSVAMSCESLAKATENLTVWRVLSQAKRN